ncbi:MAG: NAD(P)H-hydrate dehydratase [Bacillota bacterium]
MKTAFTEQVRSIDQRASQRFGVTGLQLMENAGARVAAAAAGMRRGDGPVLILAGKGNNGGDGLVAARHLQAEGISVIVALVGPEKEVAGDARVNLDIAHRCGLDVRTAADDAGLDALRALRPSLVVDALLGTGVRGAPRGVAAAAIRLANAYAAPILAVDVPSGLDADTGRAEGDCVRADRTVTMGCLKPGLVQYPGRTLAGEVDVAPIGWPLAAVEAEGLRLAVTERSEVVAWLPRRQPDAHKGTAGHLLVLAGSRGLTGAAILASRSGLRTGAGLVTLALPGSLQPLAASRQDEVMTLPVAETAAQSLSERAWTAVLDFLGRCRALALGPGFGRDSEPMALAARAAVEAPVPAVLDADGLQALAGRLDLLQGAAAPRVLTPHPGEMAALLGRTVEQVQDDRISTAREAARLSGAVVVLKGAPTVVARPDGEARLNPTGNPALGTAGSGDVLTGVIGGLLAQGLGPWEAAVGGVYVHGLSGDLAAAELGPVGVLAGDISERIPLALRQAVGAEKA